MALTNDTIQTTAENSLIMQKKTSYTLTRGLTPLEYSTHKSSFLQAPNFCIELGWNSIRHKKNTDVRTPGKTEPWLPTQWIGNLRQNAENIAKRMNEKCWKHPAEPLKRLILLESSYIYKATESGVKIFYSHLTVLLMRPFLLPSYYLIHSLTASKLIWKGQYVTRSVIYEHALLPYQ